MDIAIFTGDPGGVIDSPSFSLLIAPRSDEAVVVAVVAVIADSCRSFLS